MVNALQENWSRLTAIQKGITLFGTIALVLISLFLLRMATQPSMALLYSGLEARSAGEIVRALEQRGVTTEIKGGSIFVPAQERDSLRMSLAGEGLPANSAKGYELLDSLSGFGTTSQMFDAAYLRAKEGELARTIMSSSQVSAARVHIAQPRRGSFARPIQGSASLFLTASGGHIDADHARALQFLVASAIAGIKPEDVTVMDHNGDLLGANSAKPSAVKATEISDRLRAKVMRLLEAHVGIGNAIVEVNVETVSETESIKERRFDPEGRVVVSSDTEETSNSAKETGAAGVTVASNLPDGQANSSDNATRQTSETRERRNYEVSEIQREVLRQPGTLKQLSVAVLLSAPEENGVPQPRNPDDLDKINDLVKSAIGFNEARGDVITVQSMSFAPQKPLGSGPIDHPWFALPLDTMSLVKQAIFAVVALLIALFVIRPMFRKTEADTPIALSAPVLPEAEETVAARHRDSGAVVVLDAEPTSLAQDSSLKEVPVHEDNPIQKLREMIDTRQEETMDILRHWLEQKERKAS